MSNSDPRARKHEFGPDYQLRELPGGVVINGAAYAPDPRPVYRLMRAAIASSKAGFPASLDVADLACNGGYHGIKAMRDGANRCVFVDMSSDAIRVAMETATAWGVHDRCEFSVGDIELWGRPPMFDLVMAHQVVYHLGDPIGFLRRVHSAIRGSGVFACYTRVAHAVHPRTFEWVPSWASMVEALRHVGFRSVSFVESDGVLARVRPETRDIRSSGQEKVMVLAWK